MNRAFRSVPGRSARRETLPTLLLAVTLSATTSMGVGCSKGPDGSGADPGGSIATTPPFPEVAPNPGPTPAGAPGPGPGTRQDPALSDPAPLPAGSPSLRLSAAGGLYLLDPPLAGEPLFDGKIEVVVEGKAPPAETVVELNGVALVRETRNDDADRFWHVDASAPPPIRPDGTVTIAARSGPLTGTIDLSCPADIAMSSSTPAGASLSGSTALVLGWASALPVNPVKPAFASLRGLELATSTASPVVLAHRLLPHGAVETTLPIEETTSSGYVVEMRWQGALQRNGNSDGFCGRAKRLVYAN